ncbi:MAG: hypothetical protein JJT78_02375 [Leptospira sp.]|nr:hypothetical protein [Leptospira sp.]
MNSILAKGFIVLSVFLFLSNCATFQPHEPIPIYPDPRERKQETTPKEEIPDGFEKMKDDDKPHIIKMMRDDLQKASDYIEDILKRRLERKKEVEELEE